MKIVMAVLVMLALTGCSRDLWQDVLITTAINDGVPKLVDWID